ncbi:hypothetical protein CVT25_003882 [Psilocybe cyanescens]|uniref:Uncharacterized protein n=1 Tax=Psilocybe cyanescens TaxID=93625 RepID=A0A409XPN9_PSICY|nr:hypothetical protein CVT25_003882 [Psilocybe cyanescens]
MSSTENPPSLALSDIMHHMSPSPVPPDEHVTNVYDFGSGEGSNNANSSTESYNQVDVAGVRRRLNELGYPVARHRNGGDNDMQSGISSREKELLDMVLSLMNSVPIDPAQLERQADTISDLTVQRDFLTRQAEEDRERWKSERESWERTAEALLTQRNKPSKSEDAERMRASYEVENKALREKLQETQRRLASLESELLKLKPMLLMQPSSLSRQDKGKSREVFHHYSHNQQTAPKITVNSPATASTSKSATAAPTSAAPAGAEPNPPPPRRRSRERTNASKSQPKRTGPPIMTDAYAEHLLLAAKRIGRKRAAAVAGMNQHAEREKEALAQEQDKIQSQQDQERMEQERQERIANGTFGAYYRTGPEAASTSTSASPLRVPHITPVIGTSPLRTPKRGGIHFSNFASATTNLAAPVMESPLVYVNVNPATSTYGSPWAGSGVMGTPGQIKATLNRQNGRANTEKTAPSNPPTPLASLLDAALMMDGDGRAAGKLRGKTNGKGRALEEPPDSPVPPPKRRKVSAAGSSKHVAGNAGKGLDRVKTALDVLADQADQASAAFNEADQSDRRASVANGSNATAKGKGKAKEKPHNHHPGQGLEDDQTERMAEGEQHVNESSTTAAQESASTSGYGRGRGTRRASVASKTRTKAPPTAAPAVISSRPIRQASRKRATSPVQPAASTSAATGRGRGRPKGGASSKTRRGRSNSDAGSSRIVSPPGSRIISPPGPRVIAPAPGYSPLDEAIAMSSSIAGKAREMERKRSDEHEHAQPPPQHRPQAHEQHQLRSTEPKIGGLHPVVGWGQRDMPSSFDSDSSPIRSNEQRRTKENDKDENNDNDKDEDKDNDNDKDDDEISQSGQVSEPSAPVAAGSTITTERVSMSRSTPEILMHLEGSSTAELVTLEHSSMAEPATFEDSSMAEPAPLENPSTAEPATLEDSLMAEPATLINGHVRDPPSASPSPPPQFTVTAEVQIKASVAAEEDVDAEADVDDDQDAEGEQEDDDEDEEGEGEGEDEIVSTKHPSRSRSPPPPDPPPPGPSNTSPPGPSQDDEHDPDADAEGEVEFEDNEDHSGGGMGTAPSSSHRAAANEPEHNLARHSLTSTLSESLDSSIIPFRTHYLTNPYSTDLIPNPTCAASRVHMPVLVDASGLSDTFNAAALGLIIWVFANIPAKHEPKRGWRTNESQFRMFPVKRANKISFKWRKANDHCHE